jgi:hypothetical protein
VSRNNSVRTVDQDRVDKAEFLDAGGNLLNLLFSVRARVVYARLQLRRAPVRNLCAHTHLHYTEY